jgi:hypothetical protein
MDSIIETCKSTCAACELSRGAQHQIFCQRAERLFFTHTLAQDGDAEGLSLNYLGALSECITHIHLPPAAQIFLCRLRAARLLRLARFLNHQLRAGEASTQQPQQSINYIPRNPSPCDVVEPQHHAPRGHPDASAFCHAWKVLKAVSGTAEHKIAADGIEVLLLLLLLHGARRRRRNL